MSEADRHMARVHGDPGQTKADKARRKQARINELANLSGIPAATLRGLRDGSLVAVPREPTRAMINRGLESAVYINWREASEEMALSDDEVKHIYNLMLAAAQEPPHDR